MASREKKRLCCLINFRLGILMVTSKFSNQPEFNIHFAFPYALKGLCLCVKIIVTCVLVEMSGHWRRASNTDVPRTETSHRPTVRRTMRVLCSRHVRS